VKQAYEAGFDVHLTKPLNYDSLLNALYHNTELENAS